MPTTPIGRAVAQRGQRWLTQSPDPQVTEPPVTSTAVRNAVRKAMQQHLCDHYTRRPGVAALCQAIAERLAAYDLDMDPDESVVVTGGAAETRFLAVRALAADRTVYVPYGAQGPYQTALDYAEAEVVTFDPTGELPAERGALLVLPTHDPATGQPWTADTLQRMAVWAAEQDITVVADELATPLLQTGAGVQPFAARPGMAQRALTLGGFAETPSLGAWNVAWFAGPPDLVAQVRTLKQAMTICTPAASQYAALASLQENAA